MLNVRNHVDNVNYDSVLKAFIVWICNEITPFKIPAYILYSGSLPCEHPRNADTTMIRTLHCSKWCMSHYITSCSTYNSDLSILPLISHGQTLSSTSTIAQPHMECYTIEEAEDRVLAMRDYLAIYVSTALPLLGGSTQSAASVCSTYW